jgi:hypothetical protein
MSAAARILIALERRFPDNEFAPKHFSALLIQYLESGLCPPHLLTEIEAPDEHKLWSCIWEAMLFRHLSTARCILRGTSKASGQHGPDFCVEVDGRIIWVEATVPEPKGIPSDWLAPPNFEEIRVKSKPDQERVLRCSSVIRDKQRKFSEYRQNGIIEPSDSTVVAVNICQLSDFDIDGAGISQLPLVAEAVFPVGPIGIPLARDGRQVGPPQLTHRSTLAKATGVEIEGGLFLDMEFANVSAVIQAHQRDVHERDLVLMTVHNPNATNKLPYGLFSTRRELVWEQRENGHYVTDVARG